VGSFSLKPRLFRQQTRMQIRQEVLQLFQIAAVCERLFFERSFNRQRDVGRWRQAAYAFGDPQKLAPYVVEILWLEARTVPSFRTETKQC